MTDHGEPALPPFPFGELPPLADAAADNGPNGELPSWLALTGGTASRADVGEPPMLSVPSIPYWPGGSKNATEYDAIADQPEPSPDDTLTNCPRANDELPPLPPIAEQSVRTERILTDSMRRRNSTEIPLPPPFSAGLSELSPFLPAKAPADPIKDSQVGSAQSLERTPPPAEPLDIPPASAIWRTRKMAVAPRIEENGATAVFRTVIRDEAGRGFVNAKVAFPLPTGIKQVQASRKPAAKKGALHWNLGPLGPTDSVPLSVKIPTSLLGGPEAAAATRHFELSYQPLPGAKLLGELVSPGAVLVGEPFKISMKVSNAGELPTQDVTIRVSDRTSGGKPAIVSTKPIAPGESRTITVELLSKLEGRHDWLATVESGGSEPAESIFSTEGVRVALGLELKHDSMMRVDQDEAISLVIRNGSPVPARGVTAQLTMPEELTFASAPGGQFDRSLNLVGWAVGDIPAGETRTVVARLRGFSPGLVGIQARVESVGGASVAATSNIFVEIDARSTSSSLDKLLAALEESVPDETDEVRERPVETGTRHLVFELAGSSYAVPIENVREVVRPTRLTPVPGLPDWLPGVANVRGDIVSIIDLSLFLGIPGHNGDHRGLLIAQTDDGQLTLGLLVSNIVGIRRLPAARPLDRERFRNNPIAEYLDGIAEQGDRLTPIIRLDTLLRATERQTLQAA